MQEYKSDELKIELWICTQAPMPAELYWENMGMTTFQRLWASFMVRQPPVIYQSPACINHRQ